MKTAIIIVALAPLLAACEVPRVQYSSISPVTLDQNGNRTAGIDPKTLTSQADSGAYYFSLGVPEISFTPASGWTAASGKSPFTASVQLKDSDQQFYVTPKSRLFQGKVFSTSTTQLTLQTFPNTGVPAQVSATVTDNASEIIQAAGSVAGAIAGAGLFADLVIGASGGGAPTLAAFFIELPDNKSQLPTTPQPVPNNSGWTYQIFLDDPLAGDAMRLQDFKTASTSGGFVGYFPFPACRQTRVELTSTAGAKYEIYTQVGTPEWVEAIPIPANGKITAGNSCGASVTPGTVDAAEALKDIGTLATTAGSTLSAFKGTKASTAPKTSTPASNE